MLFCLMTMKMMAMTVMADEQLLSPFYMGL
jgi:hypothetical protein